MLITLFAALLLTAPAQASISLREQLRPLQLLVGSCWTGTFPGGTSTDTHCFEPVFGGAFVRDRHIVRGGKTPYEGETIYAWDAGRKQVVYTYWASDGGFSTGTMETAEGALVFPESHERDGRIVKMQNVWTITGKDSYDVVVSQWKDGRWAEMWKMTMRRDAR